MGQRQSSGSSSSRVLGFAALFAFVLISVTSHVRHHSHGARNVLLCVGCDWRPDSPPGVLSPSPIWGTDRGEPPPHFVAGAARHTSSRTCIGPIDLIGR